MAEASRALQTTLIPSFHSQHKVSHFKISVETQIQCSVSTCDSTRNRVTQKIHGPVTLIPCKTLLLCRNG
ncbi:hypothetical protein PRUPE_3G195800 [Prunus persica]|uniref:Uncharacterized protein n=1 Tax=Prunus persica TaxID=3760 RepID=A0A251Q3U5_PRUPE|nr:hypothetical protein PRUPE_3G195800 [Prunus persica]